MSISAIEKHLHKIEVLAQVKQKEMDEDNYKKYIGIYDIAIDFLKKEEVLIYGGMAINELMPKNLKFYSKYELPDIDLFTYDPKDIGQRLIAIYEQKGYQNAAIKGALHENTYKFYVSGLQILDLTYVTKEVFARLAKGSVRKSMGIPIVNKEFLRLSLHSMLSQPKDAHRWKKVYERLVKFYHVFPPKNLKSCQKIAAQTSVYLQKHEDLVNYTLGLLKDSPYVLFSGNAMESYLNVAPSKGTIIDIIVEKDLKKVAKDFVEELQKMYSDITLSHLYKDDSIVCDHILIMFKNKPFMGLYQPNMCVSFIEKNHYRIASIHTMTRMLMMMMLSGYEHHHKTQTRCYVEMLAKLHVYLSSNPSRKKLLQEFALECYGEQPGLITLRRKFLERL